MKIHWLDVLLIGAFVFLLFRLEASLRKWWYRRQKRPVRPGGRFEQLSPILGQIQGAATPVTCTHCSQSTQNYFEYTSGEKLCADCNASLMAVTHSAKLRVMVSGSTYRLPSPVPGVRMNQRTREKPREETEP